MKKERDEATALGLEARALVDALTSEASMKRERHLSEFEEWRKTQEAEADSKAELLHGGMLECEVEIEDGRVVVQEIEQMLAEQKSVGSYEEEMWAAEAAALRACRQELGAYDSLGFVSDDDFQ